MNDTKKLSKGPQGSLEGLYRASTGAVVEVKRVRVPDSIAAHEYHVVHTASASKIRYYLDTKNVDGASRTLERLEELGCIA